MSRPDLARYPRYALYFVPDRNSALYRFGAGLLGYDAFSGNALPFAQFADSVADWPDLTREPRGYGFHATLKAPFALAADTTEAGLIAACDAFARSIGETPVITPVVELIGGFAAIVAGEGSSAIEQLAGGCVRGFDRFRAPLTAEDRARRIPAALTPAQLAHLDRWGYPYVLEEFRFHMTLTGRPPADRQGPVLALLRRHFAEAVGGGAVAIDRIALLRQDGAGLPFRVVTEHLLSPNQREAAVSAIAAGRS